MTKMARQVRGLLSGYRQAELDFQRNHNIHANSLIIDHLGILIFGKSGFGKTTLMLSLLEQAKAKNKFAAMIGDDQSLIINANNRLIAHCLRANEGKLEVRGFGIVNAHFLPSAVINLVVEIVPHENVDRMPEKNTKTIDGVQLPRIFVPRNDLNPSVQITLAALADLKNVPLR